MRLIAVAFCLLAACSGRQVVQPARTPSAEMQSCGEAREILGAIREQPRQFNGVRRQTAERMGEYYQACTEALESERDFNADAADHNRPDSAWERFNTWLYGAGSGSLLTALIFLALTL